MNQSIMNQPMALNQFINQPVNQAIRGQPLRPQNASIQSYNNLTANQKYENLTKGTDPFVETQRTRNQTALPFQDFIFSGSSF
ncbi:hypothetical protein F8M41_002953 [Gigaspora margarita]|uniref:Uncharacterized protein n=1 Tax=Gigaspora margarita TaxID=4874 RepID=A0A8H4A6L8_GIGMA|nr:hypothetical protein F8M41_002953 [Gigaspora margarita]